MPPTPSPYTRARPAAFALLVPVLLGVVVLLAPPAPPAVRSIALGGAPQTVALLPHSARAVVADDDATVWIVDLDRARVVRRLVVGDASALPSPALALDAGTHHLFVVDSRDGFAPSLIHVLDSFSGAPRATVRVGVGAVAVAVDERRGRVVVANQSEDSVSLLDARSARPWRTIPLGATPKALAVDQRRGRAFVLEWHATGASGFPNGYGPGTGRLGVLDIRRGTLWRTVPVGAGPSALAVDARRGRVFVTNRDDSTVSMLDAGSGALLGTTTVGRLPTALAVDARRGLVYVVNAGDGTLSILDADSGRPRRTIRLDHETTSYTLPMALAVDEARDRLYLSAWGPLELVGGTLRLRGNGTLYVFDARTGAVRRRIAVGVAPQAIAVGESGRVVVVNGGGVVRAPEGWLAPWLRRLGGWLPWLGQRLPPQPAIMHVPGSLSVIDAPA